MAIKQCLRVQHLNYKKEDRKQRKEEDLQLIQAKLAHK